MKPFHSARDAALVIIFLCLISGCQRPQSETWNKSDPTFVPFPVSELVVSEDNLFVGLTVDEHSGRDRDKVATEPAVYLLELRTGNHRRLDSNVTLLPVSNHQFIAYDAVGTSQNAPLLIDGLTTVRTLDIGKHNGGWWNPKTKSVIFETGWPGDTEGFNTLSLVNPANGSTVDVHTQTSELVGVCPTTGHFYTEHHFPNGEKAGTDEYDAAGELIGTIHSPLAVYSATCRYVLPFAAIGLHGPDDWGIFDASTQIRLMNFPWIEDGKTDLHWFQSWNPHQDRLLLMHSGSDASKSDTIDVLDVVQKKVIKSWPGSTDSPPVTWSGDGAAIVTVRNQHIVFEPLAN